MSCGNKNNDSGDSSKDSIYDQNESSEDTTLTPDVIFSNAMIQDILSEEEDVDLQVYLEEDIYPMLSVAGKVTLDKVSSSLYLLSYREGGTVKNFLIKKYFDPQNNEIKFEKTETQLSPENQFLK